jgi:hypothetical protein
MARRRRNTEVFSLSFLDCICCGFGAVVLFYTIISAQSGLERVRKVDDITADVNKLEEEVLVGTKNLVVLRNTLERTESDTASASRRATKIVQELAERRDQASIYTEESLARKQRVEELIADIRQQEEANKRLRGAALDTAPKGERVKAFRGRGDRRYLTGLQLRGKHVLILVDTSASMLSDDVVEVIKLDAGADPPKRAAAKWRRAVDSVEWLTAQLPAGSKFQVYGFNTRATPVIADTAREWLSSSDPKLLNQVVQGLRAKAPKGGTSLVNAFIAARLLSPAPDQVVLLTDGLPTQGSTPPAIVKYVNARARQRLFDEAIKSWSNDIPIDVLLFPMKGDNPAAHSFWRLARRTGGSFVSPSPDWP